MHYKSRFNRIITGKENGKHTNKLSALFKKAFRSTSKVIRDLAQEERNCKYHVNKITTQIFVQEQAL